MSRNVLVKFVLCNSYFGGIVFCKNFFFSDCTGPFVVQLYTNAIGADATIATHAQRGNN